MINKKNLTKNAHVHIEIILSATIFIASLIFIFMIINPFAKTEQENSIINKIESAILNNISEEVETFSVIVNISEDCYFISESIRNTYGTKFLEVNKTNKNYLIYFSANLNDNHPLYDASCPTDNYTLIDNSKTKIYIYENIENLKQEYENNYNSLKNQLRLNNDFSFSFTDLNKIPKNELSVSKDIPPGLNVKSKEFPLKITKKNGEELELILNLKVW